MPSLYYVSVTAHLLAAFLWLGGMFFLAVVGAPVLRSVQPAALRADLFRQLGERFRTVGWAAIATLVVTGTINLHYRGLLSPTLWKSSDFWSLPLGRALAWKMGAVAAMLLFSAVHEFITGPAASRPDPGRADADRARRQAVWLARPNAVDGLAVGIAAVSLARGG